MANYRVLIKRFAQDENQTLGVCIVLKDDQPIFSCVSLERGWRGNSRNVSCLPSGFYPLVLEYSPRFDSKLWEIKDTGERTECKFHSSNYWYQLNGCIALGDSATRLNSDEYLDVLNSKTTLTKFHAALKGAENVSLEISSDSGELC